MRIRYKEPKNLSTFAITPDLDTGIARRMDAAGVGDTLIVELS